MRKFWCTLYSVRESNLEEDPREIDTEGHLPISSTPSPGCVKGKEYTKVDMISKEELLGFSLVVPV